MVQPYQWTCVSCGTINGADTADCVQCGVNILAQYEQKCPNCGTVIADIDRFCFHCRHPIPLPPNLNALTVQDRQGKDGQGCVSFHNDYRKNRHSFCPTCGVS